MKRINNRNFGSNEQYQYPLMCEVEDIVNFDIGHWIASKAKAVAGEADVPFFSMCLDRR